VSGRRWWRRRSLRARLTLLAAGALTVGLVLGAVALAAVFARTRLDQVTAAGRQRAASVAALAAADRLPGVLPTQSGELAQVLDARGAVVASSATATRTLPLLDPGRLASLRRSGPQTLRDTPASAEPLQVVVVTAAYRGEPVTVVVAEPLGDLLSTLRVLRLVLAVVVPVLVAAVAGTAWVLVGSALRPVDALRRGAEEVTGLGGGGSLPVPDSSDEVAALAGTLNRMLQRLDAAGARQRGFVADAAHELRSPLASLRTQLEVAQLLGDPPGTADLLAEVLRLGRLVDDLLVLARLDAPGSVRVPVPVDLAALARAAGATDVTGGGTGLGDHDALRRVLVNLLANADRHAEARVHVTVADGRVDVDDDGPGVPAAQRERIFERFTRLDDARARDVGGSGLGLAIARETARAAGGDVSAGEAPLGGARFTLSLPHTGSAAPTEPAARRAGRYR